MCENTSDRIRAFVEQIAQEQCSVIAGWAANQRLFWPDLLGTDSPEACGYCYTCNARSVLNE